MNDSQLPKQPSGKPPLPEKTGSLPLLRSRRLCCDVLHYAQKIPTCAHDRMVDLSLLQGLRSQLPSRISWSLIFIKAFSIVAARRPELRQSFIAYPWSRLFQHKHSVAMLAIHREFGNEPWLLWGRFTKPDQTSLVDLQQQLSVYQTGTFRETFTQQWQLSLFPTFFRRLLWFWNFNFSGHKRTKRLGTFGITTLAGKGVEIQHPPDYHTTCLTYAPFDENGVSRVTIAYDHRLMDGTTIANALIDLEEILNNEIATELQSMIAAANSHETKKAG